MAEATCYFMLKDESGGASRTVYKERMSLRQRPDGGEGDSLDILTLTAPGTDQLRQCHPC